jgi:serine/threonine-protein kinase
MTSNPQYQSLSLELQKIIDDCLNYDPTLRPTAEELVKYCESLCYLSEKRFVGRVNNLIQGGISGFIDGTPKNSFFSMESVYGSKTPILQIVTLFVFLRLKVILAHEPIQ